MYTNYDIKDDVLRIYGIDRIDLSRCCRCGQSFRWRGEGNRFTGAAYGRVVRAEQEGATLSIYPCKAGDEAIWLNYFDLERDYKTIEARLSADASLSMCVPCASGIRVFAQEPFETLITFIISANNNIGRIAAIVARLCELCGEKVSFGGEQWPLFPTPQAVASLSVEQLTGIGSGYRAPFIKKSAQLIADGYELDALRDMPLDKARKELLAFPGVGPKVADCVLLFGLGHRDAFPVDVWIGRAMSAIYFDNEGYKKRELEAAIRALGDESGIVQQYIFHYARQSGLGKEGGKSAGRRGKGGSEGQTGQ